MNLRIYNWNNYYNRIVKKLDESSPEFSNYVHEILNANFNPNDDINTEHVFGTINNVYSGEGDYLLVINEFYEIVSRWFIIEKTRLRGGQWRLDLRRDLVVDFYNEIIDAPCFIEKATLTADDSLVFNNEDMTFNEIKTREYVLKDKTQCPWIVGYYAKNTPAENLQGTIPINPLDDVYDIIIDTSFENWKYNATENPIKLGVNAVDYYFYVKDPGTSPGYMKFTRSGNYLGWERKSGSPVLQCVAEVQLVASRITPKIQAQSGTLFEQAKTFLSGTLSDSEREEFLSLNGKIIKDITGKYYKITVYQDSLVYETKNVSAGTLFNSLSAIVTSGIGIVGTPDTNSFKVHASFNSYKMLAQELTNLETTWNMTATKFTTDDAPYNIFAIPYGNCSLYQGINQIVRSSKEYALPLAQSIINKMGSNLYDIQLLPYCPIDTLRYEIVDTKTPEAYSLVKDKDGNSITYILNVPKSNFNRVIPYEIKKPTNVIETKIDNECNKYRLCSPNYNGYFDFSVVKNGGIEYFDVDCSLKPYQPYIHINPNFGGLYGQDFNDPRGLICGGDFSLSQFQNKWEEYQIQNKNYQEMFDRQIQTMEVQNKYQKTQDVISAITGSITGVVGGAATGAMASGGNPYAAAAGAIAGGIASTAGGIADVSIKEKLRNETIDYTKDQFGYQLGNIKALPYTLTKVSSFNDNNKIFPVLEFYTCTDREKEAFVNKLAYNGMTVMAIGKINDYIRNTWEYLVDENNTINSKGYIKGKIIRLPTLKEDYHLAKEISNEINLGVFI